MDKDDIEDVDFPDDVEVIYLDDDDEIDEGIADEMHEIEDEDDDRIVEEINDISKLAFKKHTNSVFKCAISKDSQTVVTGGQDDMAYLWNIDTGNVLMECTGHHDSVTEVAFSHDSQLVATADMGGLIQVWSLKDMKLVWCIEGDDVLWLQWHHASPILFVGTSAGDVYIYLVPSGNCKVLPTPGSPANCGRLLADGKRIVVGYDNGLLKLWDIKSMKAEWQCVASADGTINTLAVSADDMLIAVCPTGAVLKLTDGKVVASLLADNETEVECCAFNAELGVVVSGGLSGQICVWELGKFALRHQAKIECAATKLLFGMNGKLFIAAADGAVYVCDARTGLLVTTLTGHSSEIMDLDITANGRTVVTCGDDGTARVFDVQID